MNFRQAMAAVAAVMMALWTSGCVIIPISGLGGRTPYEEVELKRGGFGAGKILVLDIEGVIDGGSGSDGFFGSDSMVVQATEKLRKAERDDSIRAVVLRVDSPGGGVTASDVIYREVMRYKQKTKTPVYVSMLDLAASGGYYISMAGDEVYASPTTVTGSIGVIAMFPQLTGLGDKIGVSMEVVKSGANKDMGAPWHRMGAEERAILQSVIDEMYNKFTGIVAQNRTKLDPARVRELADGRIYTGEQALNLGLVDGLMYLDEVIDHAAKETGGGRPRVVLYKKTSSKTADSIYVSSRVPAPQASTSQVGLVNIDGMPAAKSGPVFQYLWVP